MVNQPQSAPLQPDDVRARRDYARTRIDDLLALNGGDLLGADAHERQRLSQEVFFHLVGAIEVLAQLVNDRRHLGLSSEDATTSSVVRQLRAAADPLTPLMAGLYANTRNPAPPGDAYAGDGL